MKNKQLAQRLRNVAYILEQSEVGHNTYAIKELNSIAEDVSLDELTKSDEFATGNYAQLPKPTSEDIFEYNPNNEDLCKMASEIVENCHESDVDQKSIGLSTRHKANTPAIGPKEETWETLQEKFELSYNPKHELVICYDVFEWLSENYNIPTRKI